MQRHAFGDFMSLNLTLRALSKSLIYLTGCFVYYVVYGSGIINAKRAVKQVVPLIYKQFMCDPRLTSKVHHKQTSHSLAV